MAANSFAYYQELKGLARTTRSRHGVDTRSLGIRKMRAIYKAEEIRLDLWPHKLKKVRAAYFFEDGQACVLLKKSIKPDAPRLFALAHELKHHLVDRELAQTKRLECAADFSSRSPIEIGAEVFAAEFIFPEAEFVEWMNGLVGDRTCGADEIVLLKRNCPAKVSYAFLVKRLEWLKRIQRGEFKGFQFLKHEYRLHGPPFYLRRRRPSRS